MQKVYGIDRTVRELKAVDKNLVNGMRKDLKRAAEPIAATIKSNLPSQPPIRGMRHKGRTGWNVSLIKTKVKTDFSRRASARGDAIVSIWVGGKKGTPGTAGLQIADMAGRGTSTQTAQGRAMIRKLSGAASRYVWKKAEQQLPEINREILISIEKTSVKINKNLVVTK